MDHHRSVWTIVHLLILFKAPCSKARVPRNTGCPLSPKMSSMCSTASSHSPFGLHVFDPYHFFSDPSPRNDQCPCANLFAYPATVLEFAIHNSLFSSSPHTMSLYTDMKMIRFVNCSGSHCISFITFWISARICNVVDPGKIVPFELHPLPVDSVQLSLLRGTHKPLNLLSPCLYGLWVWIHLAQTQYGIGEYMNFCCW